MITNFLSSMHYFRTRQTYLRLSSCDCQARGSRGPWFLGMSRCFIWGIQCLDETVAVSISIKPSGFLILSLEVLVFLDYLGDSQNQPKKGLLRKFAFLFPNETGVPGGQVDGLRSHCWLQQTRSSLKLRSLDGQSYSVCVLHFSISQRIEQRKKQDRKEKRQDETKLFLLLLEG